MSPNPVVATNIVDLVKGQISDELLGQVSSLLGNEGAKTSSAISSAVPALLSGVTSLASSGQGSESLFKTIGEQDDSLLDDMGSLLREGQASSVVDKGSSLLGNLFGSLGADKLGNVLSAFTGLSRGSTSSLMGIAAPIVIGVIKRKLMGGVTGASGLASLLQDQQSNINAAMPAGLSDQLQSSGFLSSISGGAEATAAPRVADPISSIERNVKQSVDAPTGPGWTKYLLPVVGLALLAWIGMRFLGGGGGQEAIDSATEAATGAASEATEAATGAATEATEAATGAATEATEAATGAATEAVESVANVDVGALETDLTGLFGTATETLSGVTDVESAQAALPQLEGITSSLGDIGGLMEQVPEAARGPLTSIVSNGLSTLQPIIDSALAIPGVGPVLEPIVTPLLSTLQGLAGG